MSCTSASCATNVRELVQDTCCKSHSPHSPPLAAPTRPQALLAGFQAPEDFTVREQTLQYANGDSYTVRGWPPPPLPLRLPGLVASS